MLLPQELLLQIFGHFKQRDDESGQEITEDCVRRQTLSSLCRVSSHFNATAKPLLYEHVRMFDKDIALFTRTILFDLKTRQLVKKLSLEFELPGTWGPEELDAERRAAVPRMQEGQWDYEECLGKVLDLLGLDATSAGVGGANILLSDAPDELDFDDFMEEDLAAVLLFVLPELRYLRVKFDQMSSIDYEDPGAAGYWRCDMLLQTLRLPYFARTQQPDLPVQEIRDVIPASLFHLEELVMCNPFERPGTIKSTYPPIVFCQLEEMQPFWGLPNIKSLALHRATWGEYSPLDQVITTSVEHLELSDTSIQPSQLPRLLQHFPSLRSITYELADMSSLADRDNNLVTRDMFDSALIEYKIRSCKPMLTKITVVAAIKDENFMDRMSDSQSEDSQSEEEAD